MKLRVNNFRYSILIIYNYVRYVCHTPGPIRPTSDLTPQLKIMFSKNFYFLNLLDIYGYIGYIGYNGYRSFNMNQNQYKCANQ